MANYSTTVLGPDGKPARLPNGERDEALLGAYDSYNRIAYRYAPFNPDALISSRGYAALDDQATGLAAVASPLNMTREAVLYKSVTVEAFSDDEGNPVNDLARELADGFNYVLENMEDDAGNEMTARDITWEWLYAVHVGFRVSELLWRPIKTGKYKGKLGLAGIYAKPAKQIGFDLDPKTLAVRNITSYTPQDGYQFNIPVEKVIRYTHQPKDGLPYGTAVGRQVYKHGFSLDFGQKFLNIAVEMFGVPFILANAPKAEMSAAEKAIGQIRQGSNAVLPENAKAQLIQLAAGGLSNIISALEFHKQMCAFAYLHNTLTTSVDSDSGARALGEVHEGSQEFSLGYLRRDMERLWRRVVRLWVRYNYGEDALEFAPRITLGNWDAEDSNSLAESFVGLVGANILHPGESQIRRKLGLAPIDPALKAELDAARKQAATPPTLTMQPGAAEKPAKPKSFFAGFWPNLRGEGRKAA